MYNIAIKYVKLMMNFKNSKLLLGRWNVKENTKQIDAKVFWANSDHCGDKICGDPIKNKKNFEIHKKQ